MSELSIILLSGISAAVVSSILNFFFQIHFENRKSREREEQEIKKNDKEIIEKLYGPIYSILGEDIFPGDGYNGLDSEQLGRVRTLIDQHPHLVDIELDSITYSFSEDFVHLYEKYHTAHPFEFRLDEDRNLFNHVLEMYNLKRKNLNLPYDEQYVNK